MPNIMTEGTEKTEKQCDQSSESESPFPHGGEVCPMGLSAYSPLQSWCSVPLLHVLAVFPRHPCEHFLIQPRECVDV